MNEILNFLGFTGLTSALWNLLAYVGVGMIIAAVISRRLQNHFFVWGPLALLLYAWFFLHNPLLIGLQLVVTVSGVLNLLKIKKSALWIVGILAGGTYVQLLTTNSISGIWNWIGSFGLLAIGMGLTQLPKKIGFVIMSIGGVLIVLYSGPWALKIWIWFVLNIIFLGASAITLLRRV
jgi:hypothetical protein